MLSCPKCSTPNSLDSQFCKSCGEALPEEGLAQARVKLDEMIEQGNTLFTEGRTEEAIMIADAAIESNPSHAMAYSLKGLCFERQERYADALECCEKAYALNPDSTLDRIKVAALRHRLEETSKEDGVPDRRRALWAAAGVFVFVAALGGIYIYQTLHQQPKPALTAAANAPKNLTAFPESPAGAVQNGQQSNSTANPADTQGQAQVQPQQQAQTYASTNPTSPLRSPITFPPADGSGQLPLPGGDIQYRPLTVPNPPQSNSGSVTPAAGSSSQGDGSSTTPVMSQDAPPSAGSGQAPGKQSKGIIDIELAPGQDSGSSSQPGAVQVGGNSQLAAVRQMAANQYELGQYKSAASTYERLVKMGGDSAGVRQRLGQIYSRLGESEKAVAEFKAAVQKYQDLISAGHNTAVNSSALAACKQELKLLGG